MDETKNDDINFECLAKNLGFATDAIRELQQKVMKQQEIILKQQEQMINLSKRVDIICRRIL
jgi:hypothetical protein